MGHRGHSVGLGEGRFPRAVSDNSTGMCACSAITTPAAAIIRQLIAQAQPDDFPPGWRTRVQERQVREETREI
jgi:hypothetical protein